MFGSPSSGSILTLLRNVMLSSSCPQHGLYNYVNVERATARTGLRSISTSSPCRVFQKPPSSKTFRSGTRDRQAKLSKLRAQRTAEKSARASTNNSSPKQSEVKKEPEPWQVQKKALQHKFGETGWNPRKKLSPDALEGIRALHKQQPEVFTTEVLANEFEVPAEAIRRILKSKWTPGEEVVADRRERWQKRGERIWAAKAEDGYKPPKRWRDALDIKIQPRDGTGGIRSGLGSRPGHPSPRSGPGSQSGHLD